MAIDLYWDDDSLETLLCIFNGRWQWDELRDVFRKIKYITDDVEHEVAAIVDIRKGRLNASEIISASGLQFAREVAKMGSDGTGSVVIVGASKVIQRIFDTVKSIEPRATAHVYFVETQEQARALLARVRSVPPV